MYLALFYANLFYSIGVIFITTISEVLSSYLFWKFSLSLQSRHLQYFCSSVPHISINWIALSSRLILVCIQSEKVGIPIFEKFFKFVLQTSPLLVVISPHIKIKMFLYYLHYFCISREGHFL